MRIATNTRNVMRNNVGIVHSNLRMTNLTIRVDPPLSTCVGEPSGAGLRRPRSHYGILCVCACRSAECDVGLAGHELGGLVRTLAGGPPHVGEHLEGRRPHVPGRVGAFSDGVQALWPLLG